jgi:hypothetical protein
MKRRVDHLAQHTIAIATVYVTYFQYKSNAQVQVPHGLHADSAIPCMMRSKLTVGAKHPGRQGRVPCEVQREDERSSSSSSSNRLAKRGIDMRRTLCSILRVILHPDKPCVGQVKHT